MKEIPLTQGKIALVDDEDYERLLQWKWCASWSKTTRNYYVKARNKGQNKTVFMHRIIMYALPGTQIDHINHDTLNNQKSNLRFVTQSQNSINQVIRTNNKTGIKGVFQNKRGSYCAQITKNYKHIHIGTFATKEEAHNAYINVAYKLFGEFVPEEKVVFA